MQAAYVNSHNIQKMRLKKIFLFLFVSVLFSCTQKSKKEEFVFKQKERAIDTSFISETSVNNICPCVNTLTELNKIGKTEKIAISEIDTNCYASSLHENGFGYKNDKIIGAIFQLEDGNENIAKIRLTKDFKGTFPKNKSFNLSSLTLRKVIEQYPKFDYAVQGCSDYWRYTNDTIAFYFKIDRQIKQYPLNVEYYLDKPIDAIEITQNCSKIIDQDFGRNNLVYEKPLYAPIEDKHTNVYVYRVENSLSSTISSITTFGKRPNMEIIKLGIWKEYSPEHKLIIEEHYDNKGKLIEKVK